VRSTPVIHPTRAAATACVALAFLGCATANVQPGRAAPEGLPQPSVVLVYDFAVTPADLTGNASADAPSSEEVELGRATAASLSEQLVARLEKAGIDARRADAATPTPLHALLIQGQFLDVDAGSRMKRVVIGFGAGSSRLEARVQAFQVQADGIVRIAEAEASATGAKTPGMAIPVAGGAAAGSLAVSAAVSGGMNIAKETRGGMDADAGHMAEQIAERIVAYYERHGWL
jgi:hypothetical protein